MFEGFSFDCPPSRQGNSALPVDGNNHHDDDLRIQCDSNLISPLSSRCPSPGLLPPSSSSASSSRRPSLFNNNNYNNNKRHSRSHQFPNQHLGPAPTSMPPSYVEQQQQHRLSIGSLTHRLHAHTLESAVASRKNSVAGDMNNIAEDGGPACPITPRSSPTGSDDLDMSTTDTPTITTTYHPSMDPLTPPDTDRDDDMNCLGGPSPTSSPRLPPDRSLSLSNPGSPGDSSTMPPMPDIRSQRETLSILQSTTSTISDTIRLAALLNDSDPLRFDEGQHPSSLPPTRSSSRRKAAQQPNYRGLPPSSAPSSQVPRSGPTSRRSSRIDKSHYTDGGSNAALFSDQGLGLRRRSLVLAAVSTVLENEVAQQQCQSQSSNNNNNGRLLSPRTSPEAQPHPQLQPQPVRRRSYASLSSKSRVQKR